MIARNKPIKFLVLNRHMMFQLKYIEGVDPGKSLKHWTILSEDEQNQRKIQHFHMNNLSNMIKAV